MYIRVTTRVTRKTNQQKPGNKILFTVRLEPQLMATLRKESKKSGLTLTRIIERSLAATLATK